jgi:hypothetical protein
MRVLRLVAVLMVIFIAAVLVSCAKLGDLVFRGMNNLPEGDYLSSYDSPSKDYSINIYLCNGGATTDFSIRGELVIKNESKKNIYWSYHEQEANVEWIDDDTVIINGRTLNVLEDIYDFRR